MSALLLILLGAVLVNNIAMTSAPRWRPFTAMNDELQATYSLMLAHLMAVPTVTLAAWLLYTQVLQPLSLGYLRTPAFAAIVLAIVPWVESTMHRLARHRSALIPKRPGFPLLMIANTSLLGVALLASERLDHLMAAAGLSIGAAAAMGVLLLAFAALRMRLRHADVPAAFRDAPLSLITAGIMALALMGFMGLIQE